MKAIMYHKYGSPDVLRLEETEKSVARDNEVLIHVRAASVNPRDWHLIRGRPYLLRLMAGLGKPKDTRVGADVAGVVEAAGANATEFRAGDEVFGTCRGAFAELACAPESELVKKPAGIPFEQAAAVGIAGYTALQGLRDHGQVQAGQKVLINGAAGGVGTFAVQLAKWMGAEVTGVCSSPNVELVRGLGADRVIDYTRENFTRGPQRYDVIFDLAGNVSFGTCRRVMNPKGTFIVCGGGGPDRRWMLGMIAAPLAARAMSPFVSQRRAGLLARRKKEDLALLGGLIESGKVRVVVDRCYALGEAADAVRHVEGGHARGKVVIAIA